MNDIRNTINIIEDANQIKSSIVQKISESTVDDMAELMEHMSVEDINGITMMIDVSNQSLTEGDFADKAKSIWSGALGKAKKVMSAAKLGKLKGLIKKLGNARGIMKNWEQYKAQFNIANDNPQDFIRYMKKEFPLLTDDTFSTTAQQVPFKTDNEGNITNFSAFVTELSRVAEEKLQDQVSTKTGQVTDDTPEEPDPEVSSEPETKKPSNNQTSNGNNEAMIAKASKEFSNMQGRNKGDWNYVAKKVLKVNNAKSALSDEKVRDFLAIFGYNMLNR